MGRFFGYTVLIICIGLYVVSSSEKMTQKIYELKAQSSSMFATDLYRYGDLFGMSYLPQFQIPSARHKQEKSSCVDSRPIDLYAMADSYVWTFLSDPEYYCGVKNFRYARVNAREKLNVNLDTLKTNILLIECSERNLRQLAREHYLESFVNFSNNSETSVSGAPSLSFYSQVMNSVFNKRINKNIEANVWESRIFTPVKKLKAGLNYQWFGRVDEKVVVSSDHKRLFYEPTVDTTHIESAFSPISEEEITSIIQQLNGAYMSYTQAGFDGVYLSLIPNPVTVLDTHYGGRTYNRLLERVQYSNTLRISTIDVLPLFRNSKQELYLRSDTHWNENGEKVWLNEVNRVLGSHLHP
jgi:hypothetical protein